MTHGVSPSRPGAEGTHMCSNGVKPPPSYLVHQEFSQEQEAVARSGGHRDGELDGHPLHREEAQVLQLQGQGCDGVPASHGIGMSRGTMARPVPGVETVHLTLKVQ